MRQNGKNLSPFSNEARNTYVIEHLTDALLELLGEKPLVDISISELIDKAGVGRASFYRNFNTKEDILRRHTDEITQGFVRSQAFKYDPKRFREYTVMLFEHLERNKEYCILLMKNNLLYIVGDMFDKYFLVNATDRAGQFKEMYIAGGFYNVFKFWLMGGCMETPTELADMFIGFMDNK